MTTQPNNDKGFVRVLRENKWWYDCTHDDCNKTFSRRDGARIHDETHKKKKCQSQGTPQECWKEANHICCTKASLADGVRCNNDPANKKWHCTICGKVLSDKQKAQQYNKHMQRIHNVNIVGFSVHKLRQEVKKKRKQWQQNGKTKINSNMIATTKSPTSASATKSKKKNSTAMKNTSNDLKRQLGKKKNQSKTHANSNSRNTDCNSNSDSDSSGDEASTSKSNEDSSYAADGSDSDSDSQKHKGGHRSHSYNSRLKSTKKTRQPIDDSDSSDIEDSDIDVHDENENVVENEDDNLNSALNMVQDRISMKQNGTSNGNNLESKSETPTSDIIDDSDPFNDNSLISFIDVTNIEHENDDEEWNSNNTRREKSATKSHSKNNNNNDNNNDNSRKNDILDEQIDALSGKDLLSDDDYNLTSITSESRDNFLQSDDCHGNTNNTHTTTDVNNVNKTINDGQQHVTTSNHNNMFPTAVLFFF